MFWVLKRTVSARRKEPSQRDGSFEYPQHIFWLRNKKIIFSLHTIKLKAWGYFDFCHIIWKYVIDRVRTRLKST